MPVPATIDDLSPTAGSNSPAGGETPKDGDNYLRSLSSFIAQLRDKLDGTSDTGTIKNATFSGTMAGAASWSGLQTFSAGISVSGSTGNVLSGTYTPTLTSVGNVASSSAYECQYMRVGSVVTVSGQIEVAPTSGSSTTTNIGISLPIASNIASSNQCCGTSVSSSATMHGFISGDSTNNRANLSFLASATDSLFWRFSFTYLIV